MGTEQEGHTHWSCPPPFMEEGLILKQRNGRREAHSGEERNQRDLGSQTQAHFDL